MTLNIKPYMKVTKLKGTVLITWVQSLNQVQIVIHYNHRNINLVSGCREIIDLQAYCQKLAL